MKLYATRIIPLTKERLNSPQPDIIWTYPYPVIYAKKYAGQIVFSVFYCSLGLHTTPLFGGRQGRATDKTPY